MSLCLFAVNICVCFCKSTYLAACEAMLTPSSCWVQGYRCGRVGDRFFSACPIAPIDTALLRTPTPGDSFKNLRDERGRGKRGSQKRHATTPPTACLGVSTDQALHNQLLLLLPPPLLISPPLPPAWACQHTNSLFP